MKRIPKLSEAAKKKTTPNPSLVSVISARDTKATQVSPQDTTSGAAANKVVYMNITRERKRHKSVSEVAKKEKMRDSRIGRVLLEGSVSRSPSPQELVSPPSNRRGETSLYGIRRPVALPGNTLQAQKTPSLKEKDVSQLNSQQPPSEQQQHCTDSAGNSKARLEKSNNPVPKNLPQKARRTFSHNGSQVASGGAPIGKKKEGKQPSTKKRRMNLKKVGFQKFETVVVQDKSPKFIPPEKAKKRVQKPQGSEQVEQRQEGLYNHVFSDTVMVALNCALQKRSESSIPPVTQPSSHKPGSEQSSSTRALALPSLSGNIVQMRTLSVQGSRVVAHVVKPQPQMSVAVDLSSSTTTPGQRPDRALALKPSSRSQHATEPSPYTAALKVPPPSRAGWETVLFGDIAFTDQRSASGTERQDKCRQSPLLNKQPTVSGEISRRPSAVNSERMSAAKSGEKSAPGLDLCHQESIQASVANAETLSVSSQKNSKTSLREDGAPRPVEGDASGRSLQITRVLSHGGRKSQTDDPVGPLCTRSASMSEIRAAPKSSSATQPQRSGVSGVSDPRRTSTTETAHTLQVPGSTPSTQTTGSSGVSGVRRMSATETAHLGSMKHQSSTQTTGSSGVSGVRRMSATETAHLGSMKHQSSTQTTGSSGVSGVRRMSATETAHLGSMKHQSSTQTTGSSGVSGVSDPRRTSATEAAHSGKVPASKSSGGGSRGPPVPRKIVSTHLKLPLIPPTLFSRYKKSHTVNFVSEPVTLPSSSETPNTCHLSPAVQKMQDKVIFETAKLKLIELRKDTPCTRAVDKTPSSSQVALDTPTCPAPNDPPCGPPQSPKDLPPPLSSVPRADTDLQSLSTTPKRKGGPPLSPQPVQEGSQQNSTSPQGQSCPQLQSASKSSNKGTAKLTPGPQLECVTGEASSDGPAVKVQPPAVSPSSPPVTMSSPLHQMARAREKSKSNSPKLDFIISSLKSKKTGCGSGPERNSDHCGRRREKGANHSGSETELNAAHSGRDADHNGIDADRSGRSVDHSGRDADHSGRSVDHSGRDADHSGRSVDHSGRDADHSGRSVDHSGRDADHSGRSVNHSGRDADDSGRSVNHSGRDADDSGRSVNHSGRYADDNGGGVDHSGRDADHSGRSVNHSGRYADDNGGGVDHSGRDADHSSRSVDHSGTGSEESAGSKTEQNVDHNSEKGPENVAKCTASDAGASLEITVEGRSKKIKRKKSSSNVPETTKKLRVISKSVDSSGGKRRRAEDTTTQPTPRKKQSKKVCIALEASKKV